MCSTPGCTVARPLPVPGASLRLSTLGYCDRLPTPQLRPPRHDLRLDPRNDASRCSTPRSLQVRALDARPCTMSLARRRLTSVSYYELPTPCRGKPAVLDAGLRSSTLPRILPGSRAYDASRAVARLDARAAPDEYEECSTPSGPGGARRPLVRWSRRHGGPGDSGVLDALRLVRLHPVRRRGQPAIDATNLGTPFSTRRDRRYIAADARRRGAFRRSRPLTSGLPVRRRPPLCCPSLRLSCSARCPTPALLQGPTRPVPWARRPARRLPAGARRLDPVQPSTPASGRPYGRRQATRSLCLTPQATARVPAFDT